MSMMYESQRTATALSCSASDRGRPASCIRVRASARCTSLPSPLRGRGLLTIAHGSPPLSVLPRRPSARAAAT
eukprot:scaffold28272_cov101-Isochrysis_galbana.AAC.6